MAFLAALPELAEAGAAGGAEAGAAGGAAGGAEAGGAAEGVGMPGPLGKLGGLFKPKPKPMASDGQRQQNQGDSRTENFMDSANAVRGALRGA